MKKFGIVLNQNSVDQKFQFLYNQRMTYEKGEKMYCEFIASRMVNGRSLKLFRVAEYQYEICELLDGNLRQIRLLSNQSFEEAVETLNMVQ